MWYLLACIATPMATSCTEPTPMPNAEVCEFVADNWRGNALTANTRAIARTRCLEITDRQQRSGGSGIAPNEIPVPKL